MAVYSPKFDEDVAQDIGQCDVPSKDMTLEDLRELSNIFASEFNSSDMHDRVLCFEIIEDEESASSAGSYSGNDESQSKIETEDEEQKFEEGIQAKDERTIVNLNEEVISADATEVRHEQEIEQREKRDNDFECQSELAGTTQQDKECKNIEVEGKVDGNNSNISKLFVHSQWLSVQSPYFKALFYSGMKESYSKEVILKIYEHELQAHLTLIEAIYKLDTLNDKDYRLIVDVLVLAHKYDVRQVIKKCKYVLMSSALTLQMCEYILQKTKHITDTACMYDMLEMFLVKEFTPIDKTWTMEKFTALSEESLRLLFKSDSLSTQSENTIFVALMKWIRKNIPLSPRNKLNNCCLLDVVRFEFMSVDFLYDIVQHHYLAKRMAGFNKYLLKGLAYHGLSQIRREQLETKLKKRPLLKEDSPTFSWVIDEELEKKLSNSPGEKFFSDTFWFRGYEMQLELKYTNNLSECGFFLYVLGLPKEACIHISYTATSNLFAKPMKLKHLFTREDDSWGYHRWTKNTAQQRKSYKIDIWVEFV